MEASQWIPVSVLFLVTKLQLLFRDECVRLGCEYLFVVDSEARINDPETLRSLITANK